MATTSSPADECPFELPDADESFSLSPVIEKYELALMVLLGFAGFSVMIGIGYNALRKYVFKDVHKFDVIFDAGGKVSLSLTTVTATSQLMWPADFLQSPTIASKVGIGGSIWYTMAIVISILMFTVLCMHLKTRAPGAKTFPQVAYARFGRPAHILFCVVALFTNLVIVANLILAGKAAIEVLTKNSSNEFVCLLMAVLFGSYCLIGGLGTTFYISYFNTSLIFITASFFILKTSFIAEPDVKNVTSMDAIYEAMSCIKGPEGNYGESMLTFRSESGLIYGVVLLFMTIAIIFCDQANWQSKIAAKPTEGMVGFLIAAFLWFSIPTSVSYMASLTYQTMSFKHGSNLLTPEEIDAGHITPFVVQSLLGREGCFVLLTLIMMTLMSTGSGEVMSVSSILVYDIYKTHIRPFRSNLRPTDCILCGKTKLIVKVPHIMCDCPSSTDCAECEDDIQMRLNTKMEPGYQYKCDVHGKYRHYEDDLTQYKSWCMIWVIISIIPIGLLIIESGMNLNWTFLAAQVFIAPFLVPLFFTIGWVRATGRGLIAGGLVGLLCAVIAMLAYGSTYDGGLNDFYTNTAQDYSILAGLVAGVVVSIVVSMGVSMLCPTSHKEIQELLHQANTSSSKLNGKSNGVSTITHNGGGFRHSKDDIMADDLEYEWQKTMSIDNPLNPYKALYREELETITAADDKITTHHMQKILRRAKIISTIGAAISFVVFLVLIPAWALSQTVLDEQQMTVWISVCQYWCLTATVLVVVLPPIQEIWQICRQVKNNKVENKHTSSHLRMTNHTQL